LLKWHSSFVSHIRNFLLCKRIRVKQWWLLLCLWQSLLHDCRCSSKLVLDNFIFVLVTRTRTWTCNIPLTNLLSCLPQLLLLSRWFKWLGRRLYLDLFVIAETNIVLIEISTIIVMFRLILFWLHHVLLKLSLLFFLLNTKLSLVLWFNLDFLLDYRWFKYLFVFKLIDFSYL
jgi:hypothetical protein